MRENPEGAENHLVETRVPPTGKLCNVSRRELMLGKVLFAASISTGFGNARDKGWLRCTGPELRRSTRTGENAVIVAVTACLSSTAKALQGLPFQIRTGDCINHAVGCAMRASVLLLVSSEGWIVKWNRWLEGCRANLNGC